MALATCARPIPQVVRPGAEPDMRIAVATDANQVRIGGSGPVVVASRGAPIFRLNAGETITVAAEGHALAVAGAKTGRYESLSLAGMDRDRFVEVNGKPYRGAIELLAGSGVTAVNVVPLEAYVAGVINAEMGPRAPDERAALEAQAIVSRTYAMFHKGGRAAAGYDLVASTTDQVYGGVAAETSLGWEAVRATVGQVVTYDGRVIEAFFHSTCGYATASPEEVFRFGRAVPYLRSVSDKRPGGGYYCDMAPHFRWTAEWDGEELTRILRRTVPAVMGVEASKLDIIRDVQVYRTGSSGRVLELRITVGSGSIPVFGPDVRAVLQVPDGSALGSTAFQLRTERSGGVVRRLVADGVGWGHGVGFCQWGAVGRARAGQNAQTIVLTYFPGTAIVRWY